MFLLFDCLIMIVTSDGSVLVQLVSVPVRNLPDLTFVYGLLHLYKNPEQEGRAHQQVKQDVGFPVQGANMQLACGILHSL